MLFDLGMRIEELKPDTGTLQLVQRGDFDMGVPAMQKGTDLHDGYMLVIDESGED